jgi:hypothetical protein
MNITAVHHSWKIFVNENTIQIRFTEFGFSLAAYWWASVVCISSSPSTEWFCGRTRFSQANFARLAGDTQADDEEAKQAAPRCQL